MAEHFLGKKHDQEAIRQQLALYRRNPEHFIKASHPQVSFTTLEMLAYTDGYASCIHQPLLREALERLPDSLSHLPGCYAFDPARVWVGLAAPADAGWFGGFYHADQGYRYLQQIALTSLSGALSHSSIDKTLQTLELLRAYVHDTLHYATYRLFCPIPPGTESSLNFYRLQYGINFRRWQGQSYSARDTVRSSTTHNLGNIMEAATDRFAQEFVLKLSTHIAYRPTPGAVIEDYLYRDCTGQLTQQDLLLFRSIERRCAESDLPLAFKAYLRQMRLFVQYVTMRYGVFLAECGGPHRAELHELILQAMMSGKLHRLQYFLNRLRGETGSFVTVFKTPEY
ncbi:MAG: hypothetical protein ABI456_13730 [Ktedonobacteraceae bacterium]